MDELQNQLLMMDDEMETEVTGWEQQPTQQPWPDTPTVVPPPSIKMEDKSGMAGIIAAAIPGASPGKVANTLDTTAADGILKDAAKIVLRNNATKVEAIGNTAIAEGNPDKLEASVTELERLNKALSDELSAATSVKTITQEAVSNIVQNNPRTTVDLDGKTHDEIVNEFAAAEVGDKWYLKWDKVGPLVKNILLETYYRGGVISSFQTAFGLTENSTTAYYFSTNTLKRDMRTVMSGMTNEELYERLNNAITLAKQEGVDGVTLAGYLLSIVEQDSFDRYLTAAGDVLGPVGDLLAGVGIVGKVAKSAKATKIIGDAGGGEAVGKLVGQDMAKGEGAYSAEEANQFAQKFSVENILPEGVFGASSAVQTRLVQDTSALLSDMQNRLKSMTTYNPELDEAVRIMRSEFDPNVNRAVRGYDVGNVSEKGVEGFVTWGNRDGTSFATAEAAEAFAKRQKMTNYEVIKDTSEAGFALKQNVLDAYKKELEQLRKIIAESSAPLAKVGKGGKVVYHGSTTRGLTTLDEAYIRTGEGKATEGYGFYFSDKKELSNEHADLAGGATYTTTIDETKMFSWDGYVSEASKTTQRNILKAIKEISPGDYNYYKTNGLDIRGKELYMDILQGSVDSKRASDVLAKHGVQGHTFGNMGDSFNYDAISRGIEGQYNNYVVYPGGKPVSVAELGKDVPKSAGGTSWTDDEWFAAVEAIENGKHTYDNVFSAKSGGVLKNISPAIKVSNDIGKKASEAIGAWHKMLGFGGRKVVVITEAEAKKLAKKFTDMDVAVLSVSRGSPHAVHYVRDNINYIVMRQAVNTNDGLYSLAHEFGHMFEGAFKTKYAKQIEAAWVEWNTKHLPKGGWEAIHTQTQLTRATSFRVPTHIAHGDDFKDYDQGYRAWLAMKEEWFAEQFSKWLIHNPIPRTQWEKLLSTLANKLTQLAKDLSERMGFNVAAADKNVTKFLNEHIIATAKAAGAKAKKEKEMADTVARADELEKLIATAEEAAKLPYHGYLVKESRVDDIRYAAIGGFDPEDLRSSFWVGIDPKHLVSEFLVEGRVVGIHAEAKMMKSLSEFMIEAVNPLDKNGLQKVYATLKKGDAYSEAGGMGKEFNAMELASMGLNDKEQTAYFKLRTARNVMFELRDQEYASAMRKQGFKEIGITFDGGKSFVSKGKETTPQLGTKVYDVANKTEIVVDQTLLDRMATTGERVVKMEEVYTPGDRGAAYRTFLVNDDNVVVTDITSVLNKRTGEFSRIYTDEYFITMSGTQKVDGTTERIIDTVHTAASKEDAEAFVKGMNALVKMPPESVSLKMVEDAVGQWVKADEVLKNIQDGMYVGAEFGQHYNRITDEYVTNFTRGLEGSMFTGRRGQRLTSISENKDNIMDIFGSLQAEITNTARVVGRTDWRNAAIQRWYNSAMAADALPDHVRALSPTQAFEWAGQADFKYVGSGKEGKFLERTHKYIRMQLGMKTKDEELWETVTRTFSERYLSGALEPVGKRLRQTSPGAFIRTVNFHSMLGFMNPSQLFVQTMGAVAAIALHPIYGAASGKAAPLIRMAMMSDNEEVWRTFGKVNNFAELGFGSVDDFVDTIKGLRKSGLLDGINSTSLYNIEDGAYNVFSNAKRRFGKASLWTFNRGEEMARIISFDVARKEWQAANPGMDFLDDNALRAILIRTDDFTQNMTRANEAFFQRGALSIPTQFLQYQVKLYANILHAFGTKKGVGHRGFTRDEAIKIAAGHLVLFGVANNGMTSMVEEWVSEASKGLSDDQRFYISQGIIAGLFDSMAQAFTGEELKTGLGARLSTFDWYQKMAESITESKFLEVAMGPTYSWVRTKDKIGQVLSMWVADENLTFGEALDGLKLIGETQISSWRNATKAYVASLHQGRLQSSTGDDVAVLTQNELLFQALGIAPIETVQINKLNKSMKDHYTTLREITNTIAAQQQRSINAFLEGDDELGRQLASSAISLMPTNAGDRDFVLRNLRKMAKENKGYNEAVAKYLMKRPDVNVPFVTDNTGE